jgi:hypothetical protein
MSKKNKNQNKKEDKSQQIYLGNGLATILKEVKPLFETRTIGWECPLKNLVDDDITAVYESNGEVYAVSCDLFDTPFSKLSSEIRNQIREEAIKWLKEQPQTQGKFRE